MAEAHRCPQCHAELPVDAPQGVCPKCLLKLGLGSQPDSPSGTEPAETTPQRSRFVPPEPEELAQFFPKLEILELVGSGGMGAVYKARQPGLDRLVALKILPPEVGRDPAFAERFTREARAMARLAHPNIVAVHDFGQTPSPQALSFEGRGAEGEGALYYFVMEFVEGANLRQMIQAGRLQPHEALAIVPQICEALQFAHDEGIVHRDIKPENILVDKKGRLKIADFGLAKLLGKPPVDFTLTGTGQVMGTPHYMAPEQMERPLEVDHRADIYSLGVVFYEMLTGELPLGRFAPPSKKVQVDVRLDQVVLRALEKEPRRRYQQVTEVKTEVEQISSTSTPSALQAAPVLRTFPGGRRNLRQHAPLLVKLGVWTGALVAAWLYLMPKIWADWWPTIYNEHFEIGLEPQSGAYRSVRLRAERRLYCWGQREDRPIAKREWAATATIDLPEPKTRATLEFDSFLERWRWAPPVGEATSSRDELRPQFVAEWMKAAGIDTGKPGVQEEAAELIRLVKDAANGMAPGGKSPKAPGSPSGTKIGPYTSDGTSSSGFSLGGQVVDFRLVAAAVFLAVWSPGMVVMLRRHRRRLAAARAEAPSAEAPSPPAGDPGSPPAPRFSRKAILGAVWAAFFFVAILPSVFLTQTTYERPSSSGPESTSSSLQSRPHPVAEPADDGPQWWQWVLIFTLLPLGATAPFGTTILGAVSLGEIRHSRGRLIGLPLALADVLLFPLLLLDALICFACYYPVATYGPIDEFVPIAIIVGVLICVAVDVLIVLWAWRRAARDPEAEHAPESRPGKRTAKDGTAENTQR